MLLWNSPGTPLRGRLQITIPHDKNHPPGTAKRFGTVILHRLDDGPEALSTTQIHEEFMHRAGVCLPLPRYASLACRLIRILEYGDIPGMAGNGMASTPHFDATDFPRLD